MNRPVVPTIEELELINIDSEIDAQLDKVRNPGDKANEQKLLRVIEEHRYGLIHGLRTEEFDKVIKYLDFYQLSSWKKAAIYAIKSIGILLAFVLILALLGVGYR